MTRFINAEPLAVRALFPRAKTPAPAPTLTNVEQVWFTEEDYLAQEERAVRKHEFHPAGQIAQKGKVVTVGKIVAMAGASARHCMIAHNEGSELYTALNGKRCEAYGSDFAIKMPSTGLLIYPDRSVICSPVEYSDEPGPAAVKPPVVVEILNYKQLGNLRDYLLVSTNEALIKHFHRQENDAWTCSVASGLDQAVLLDSIGAMLALADVYARVSFTEK